MLIDARLLPPQAILETDLCIVGSGPSAVTLAREFDHGPTRVLMLEAGGLRHEPGSGGDRWCGGAANRWVVHTGRTRHGVRLLPLAPADFEERPALRHGGWPIARGELDPYYARAQRAFGLAPLGYDVADWEEPWARALPIQGDKVRTGVFQFGAGEVVADEGIAALTRSGNITLCHHATALELLSNEQGSRVAAVRVASAPGRELLVKAGQVVLAGGGFCAAELLLASDHAQPAGLGNAHDVVGRYFMDHPLLLGGEFVPASPRLFDAAAFYDLRDVRGTSIMGHLTLSDATLRREAVLNLSMMLFPRGAGGDALYEFTPRQDQAVKAAGRLRRAWRGPGPSARDLVEAARGADGLAKRLVAKVRPPSAHLDRGGWSQRGGARGFTRFEVLHQAEQAPHPDNRIALTHERDALGRRKARLEWRWHAEDVAAAARAQDVFAEELRRAGLGEFRIARPDGVPVVLTPSTQHHMGATRMSDDPRSGVVDRDCRVHGVSNLFVASSSVFPTGGFANPTLTIAALSLRLADHLKRIAQAPPRVATAPQDAPPRVAERRPAPEPVPVGA